MCMCVGMGFEVFLGVNRGQLCIGVWVCLHKGHSEDEEEPEKSTRVRKSQKPRKEREPDRERCVGMGFEVFIMGHLCVGVWVWGLRSS